MSDIRTKYCGHPNAVPVESAGETVAALCPDCDTQLPAKWLTCKHRQSVEITMFGERPSVYLCNGCGGVYWEDDCE